MFGKQKTFSPASVQNRGYFAKKTASILLCASLAAASAGCGMKNARQQSGDTTKAAIETFTQMKKELKKGNTEKADSLASVISRLDENVSKDAEMAMSSRLISDGITALKADKCDVAYEKFIDAVSRLDSSGAKAADERIFKAYCESIKKKISAKKYSEAGALMDAACMFSPGVSTKNGVGKGAQ